MTTSLQEKGPGASDPARQRNLGIALVVILTAQLMVVLDSTIANIAIPYIANDLDFSDAGQSWIITGYTIAFGGLLLLGGRLGDLFGRRRVFMGGVLLFSLASLLGGISSNQELLLASRALQGVGAAIASPTALALITTNFPAGKARNRAFSAYATMSGVGAAVGLILGGWLTEYSWRWTFLINVPVGIAAAALAPIYLNESARRRVALDIPGALTGTGGLVGIVYGLTRAAEESWGDTWTITSLAAGVALLAVFIQIERTVKEPLLPFRILANRTRAVSFLAMMLVPAAMFAMFYFLAIVVQEGMGYSSLETGFAFLPFSAGLIVAAAIASNLMSRVDPRWLAGGGTLLGAIALYGFSRIPYNDGTGSPQALQNIGVDASYATDLLPWIIVMSVGMGFVFVPLTVTAVHGVGNEDSGIGAGVLNAMQQIGGALGLATLSTVAVNATKDKANEIAAGAQKLMAQLPGGESGPVKEFQEAVGNVAFAHGATLAFVVGAGMMLAGSLITLLFLNASHEEINDNEGEAEPVAVA
ncbi:DHA2 family efflux MFS transporter permease subunit [Solicola gregarius]|uniref:DHA2 family efflux MFS transporter permease subunit n=1 Tax=Solicola gregarius TaxID=2908642 RepID=A0AA46YLC1_9ACTN|nr:DHA2 family efflux MFS transporter permease subunit [Solicola gregarius]UYM04723.1 DHA2 family efflux MFS transporter permease subunit [Solicola gregarius]